ncbi:MAG: hypothetical protein WA902_15860 [Thermosynechococcaceae cyanobacterium]
MLTSEKPGNAFPLSPEEIDEAKYIIQEFALEHTQEEPFNKTAEEFLIDIEKEASEEPLKQSLIEIPKETSKECSEEPLVNMRSLVDNASSKSTNSKSTNSKSTSSKSTSSKNASSKNNKSVSKYLKLSSSFFAILGGVLLASNTSISGYGFLFLSLSSGQLFLASLSEKDKIMLLYSSSLFCFVDCMGIYRWLLS